MCTSSFTTDGESTDRDVEYRAVAQSGDVVWLHNRIHVARGEDGRPRHLLGFMLDITGRKRTEEELSRLLAREQEARSEAQTLNALGRRLAAELDPKALVQAVTDAATTLTGAAFGAFFYNVTDERGESYMLHALSGVLHQRERLNRFLDEDSGRGEAERARASLSVVPGEDGFRIALTVGEDRHVHLVARLRRLATGERVKDGRGRLERR